MICSQGKQKFIRSENVALYLKSKTYARPRSCKFNEKSNFARPRGFELNRKEGVRSARGFKKCEVQS